MKYKIVFPLALAVSFLLAAISSKADTFSNNVAASIPDDYPNSGQQLVVTFNVSNLQTSVQSVSLTISMYHQWVGDLDVQLTSPTGTNCIIFSRVGPDIYANGWGNPDTLGTTNASGFYDFLTYTFADSATYTLRGWSSKTYGTNSSNNPGGEGYPIASGSYRTSSAGPTSDAATTFAASGLVGLSPAQANGPWTLRFRDGNGNTGIGAVQWAKLVLNEGSSQPLRFSSIGITNGIVTMNLSGPNSQSFTLYGTTNLSQGWKTNGGGTFDASGKATISTNTVGPKCFYRVSSP